MHENRRLAAALGFAAWAGLAAAADVPTAASWIWYPENIASECQQQSRYLRRVIRLAGPVESARLRVIVDDSHHLRVNGAPAPRPVESGRGGQVYDLTKVLQAGENVLAFEVFNAVGTGGLIATGIIRERGGAVHRIRSDAAFRASRVAAKGWDLPGFDDSSWPAARVVGSAFAAPWFMHPAFDVRPFIEPADWARWNAWRAPMLAAPKGLDQERPARAKFETINGSCALVINGAPRPALIYRGTVDPFSTHGRRQIALFRDAGVHVYTAYLPLSACWKGERQYDFSALDDRTRGYLSADPKAYVIWILRLVPPRWWMDAHPEELVRYAAGSDYNTSNESGRVRRPSLASKVWLRDALHVWRAAIEHLERQPWGKRVIGYQPGYGIYTEWHYFGSWRQQMPDTGPAMRTHFRTWLRQEYATVERLRRAWGMPSVTFDNAAVPGVEPRLRAGALGLRDPVRGRWVMDYYRCQQEVTADDIEAFCAAAKQITGGRVLCGAFYGYFYGVPPQTQGGHLELERLLRSQSIDYFAAPYDYSHRLMGDDGRPRALVDAFALAGKVHMIEADTRTHLHPRNEYGRLHSRAESIAAIRREAATAMLHGCALWWCDFGADGSGGWYDEPALIREVARVYALAEKRLHAPRRRVAQVALVADLKSCYWLGDGEAMRTHLAMVDRVTTEMYRTGVPFDSILLSQLGQADLSHYRLLVFLNTLRATEAERAIVANAVKGRSALWLWAPGVTDGQRFGPTLVEKLTGFHVALPGRAAPVSSVVCSSGHPLTAGIPAVSTVKLTPRRSEPVVGFFDARNWFNPRDEKAMKQHYTRFDWRAADGAMRWRFATTKSWTDIHMNARIGACDGLRLTVSGKGAAVGASLRVVVKSAGRGEFVAPAFAVSSELRERIVPFAACKKAPWDRSDATQIAFPLKGLKLVLDGTGGGRAGELIVRGLAQVWGATTRRETPLFGGLPKATPLLAIDDPEADALGRGPATGAVLLACKGAPGRRRVLSTFPYVPRQFLRALMKDAGVQPYIDSPRVIVRADSDMVALHTKAGGAFLWHLPRPAVVYDAFTGQRVGRGAAVPVQLPANSTTLLRLRPK